MNRKNALVALTTWIGLAAAPMPAQSTAVDPGTLAKYDLNKNGRLDAAEVAAMDADQRKNVGATTASSSSAGDSVIQLSPFEVVSDNKGYFSGNTMSGTRINSKLEDLGAAISIVTKEQMSDFALLDMNDIFNYEASTEGTGNYTDFVFNRNGEPESATQLNPQAANRIRGIGAANTTLGNFETSGRVPIDPLNIDAVEINRGPNSSIFGIGSVAGTVNSVPSAANLSRDRSQLSLRGDSFGGYRSTIDLNRVLSKDVLAVRGSAAYQHDGFNLKPSGLDITRLNAMGRFKPFRKMLLTASYSTYRMHGNRPNVSPPRETISSWLANGRPTWDPVARTLKQNGVVTGTFPTSIPAIFTTSPHNVFTNYYVDQSGIGYASAGQSTTIANPNVSNAGVNQPNSPRLVNIVNDPTGFRNNQPLYAKIPTATDRSIYDWTKTNISAVNKVEDKADMVNVLWDQVVFDTPRQQLATQVGWFREQTERFSQNHVGVTSNVSTIAGLHIDVNERMMDGTPNPYFLRPFFGATTPLHTWEPTDRDTYRGQLAYKLDLRSEKSWLRWLGMHQVTGYDEYKEIINRRISYYHAIVDKHSWLGAGAAHAGRGATLGGLPVAGPNVALGYFRYYLGDNQGANVDYGASDFSVGTYPMVFGNPGDGFVRENVTIGPAAFSAGGSNNFRTILKSRGAIIQSHWLKDRIVTTFGVRRDQRFGKAGTPLRLLPDGVNVDYTTFYDWANTNWQMGKGPTRTAGLVVKPFHWLQLYANRSDSFQPASVNQDLYLRPIGDPTGTGEDYGFGLNLFSGKLYIRANHYKTQNLDRRGGQAQSFAVRARNLDFTDSGNSHNLQSRAGGWVDTQAAAQGITLTPDQRLQRVADILKLPLDYLRPLTYGTNAVEDNLAQGDEIEVHFNPTNFWTLKANIVRQESKAANISPEVNQWIAERLPIWRSIIDPITGLPWWTSNYTGETASSYLTNFVTGPLALAQALEGKSLPQIRKYRVNASMSYRLAGLSDHPIIKRFNVGGAARWEDKGAIGFYGVEQPPAIVSTFDANRPIWDRSHLYLDAFVSYRAPLTKKINANWQLNVRNLTEDGRLQPIAADPDGRPNAFRIIDPRQFILTVTFDL